MIEPIFWNLGLISFNGLWLGLSATIFLFSDKIGIGWSLQKGFPLLSRSHWVFAILFSNMETYITAIIYLF